MGGGTRCRSPSSALRVIRAGCLDRRVLRTGLLSMHGQCQFLLQCLMLGAPCVDCILQSKVSRAYLFTERSKVSPNMCEKSCQKFVTISVSLRLIWLSFCQIFLTITRKMLIFINNRPIFTKIWHKLSQISGHHKDDTMLFCTHSYFPDSL